MENTDLELLRRRLAQLEAENQDLRWALSIGRTLAERALSHEPPQEVRRFRRRAAQVEEPRRRHLMRFLIGDEASLDQLPLDLPRTDE
ncbi:hypothetical protein EKE94_03300 [Mesobaculum littorinae]|uniref:Uncharacterized protein n=1 Tax=Mesobaculum littorinae TaxID=2486419 RepID=A0A438AM30_9RHOB|nr:hypothetical protein EKE94_03300 [Mesobaculum littorinae]